MSQLLPSSATGKDSLIICANPGIFRLHIFWTNSNIWFLFVYPKVPVCRSASSLLFCGFFVTRVRSNYSCYYRVRSIAWMVSIGIAWFTMRGLHEWRGRGHLKIILELNLKYILPVLAQNVSWHFIKTTKLSIDSRSPYMAVLFRVNPRSAGRCV